MRYTGTPGLRPGKKYKAVVIAGACLALALPAGAAVAKPNKKADLVVTSLGEPPATLAAGATMTISDTVRNRRARAKASANGYFLSQDKFRDLSDVALGSRPVPRLKSKKKSLGEIAVSVPALIPSGAYRLLACADTENRVKERRETNNCQASNGVVNVAGVDPADTTPPTSPLITATTPSSPANDHQPEVRGTSAEANSTVRIYATADCTGTPIGTGTAVAFNGPAGITVTVADDQTTNLRATATDASSNVSPCSAPFAYTENSSLPVAPTITDTDPNSPADDNNPEVKGTGAETGSTVKIYATTDCSGTPIGSGSAAAFNGTTGITAAVGGDTTTNLSATATDDVNNVSACSVSFAYTEDSLAPAAPTITDTDPNSPFNDNNPEVRGTAEAGSTVRIYETAGCSGSPIGSNDAVAFAGAGITVAVGQDQTTNLRATATDAAGNISACSAAFPYIEDSTAPTAPGITDTDPNSPANDNNPKVKGTGAETGSTVRLWANATCTDPSGPIGIGTKAQFEGAGISVLVGSNQVTNLRVTATDEAGNRSPCSASFPYTEDSTAPATPAITATDPVSPAADPTPEVQGTAEAGSTVEIFATSDCSGSPLASGSATTFGGAGITVTVVINATTQLRANATDAAGNTSGCSGPFSYTEVSGP